MRVLQVVQELRRGGAETVVLTLVRALAARGHECHVAAADGPWRSAFEVPVHRVPLIGRRAHRVPVGMHAVSNAVWRSRPDVVHVHNPAMALLAAPATGRGRRVPSLVTVHGVPEEDYSSAARLLRLTGMTVVACGPAVADGLRRAGGRVDATVVNGVASPASRMSPADLRRELRLNEGRLVASVGRLVPLKRHDLAIHTVARLPQVTLLIVGAGPEEGALRELARRLGVEGRVVFTGLRDDVPSLLSAVDALLMCSRAEGLPLAALEAMAAGAPVVATDVTGVRELLRDGHDALLRPADSAALAEALTTLLTDTSRAATMTRAAHETVAAYSVTSMVEAYLDLYQHLARRGAR